MDTGVVGSSWSLECRDLGSGHRAATSWLWNLGRLPDKRQENRT